MKSPAFRLAERLATELGPAAHTALEMALGELSDVDLAALENNWPDFWARPAQLPPPTPWRSFGIMSGRAFGKTRALAQFVVTEAEEGRAGRIALCAPTEDDTRDIMVEGQSGLIAVSPPWFKPKFEPTLGRLTWPNGATAFLYTASEPEHFRGPEHHLFWGDELGAWPAATWGAAWYNMRMGLRLGAARLVWSSTPRTVELIRLLIARSKADPSKHVIVRGSTLGNRANLPADYIPDMLAEYGGTRLGQQEIEGEFLEDEAGAMFRSSLIEVARVTSPPTLARIVVSVDPAITARKGSDETGIVVVGADASEPPHFYVLEDLSGRHPPDAWARIAVSAHARHGADCIVAELNRGGNMVTQTIRAADPTHRIRIAEVNAKLGKRARAEPVSALYERGRVHHVRGSQLAELEKQMLEWNPTASTTSPDRIDALVQGLFELGGLSAAKGPAADYTSVTGASKVTHTGASGAKDQSIEDVEEFEADDDDGPRGRWG